MDQTPLVLTWLGTESGEDGCPTAFATDRGTYVVQGWKVTDPTARQSCAPVACPTMRPPSRFPPRCCVTFQRDHEADEGTVPG